MNKLTKIVLMIAVLAGIILAAYFGNSFLKLKKIAINNEARFQCAQSSRFTTADEKGNSVWYPVSDLYLKCLQERGL